MQSTKGQKSTKVLFFANEEFPMDLDDYPTNSIFTIVRSLDELGCAIRHEDTKYDIFSVPLDSGLETALWLQRNYPNNLITTAELVVREADYANTLKRFWKNMK